MILYSSVDRESVDWNLNWHTRSDLLHGIDYQLSEPILPSLWVDSGWHWHDGERARSEDGRRRSVELFRIVTIEIRLETLWHSSSMPVHQRAKKISQRNHSYVDSGKFHTDSPRKSNGWLKSSGSSIQR